MVLDLQSSNNKQKKKTKKMIFPTNSVHFNTDVHYKVIEAYHMGTPEGETLGEHFPALTISESLSKEKRKQQEDGKQSETRGPYMSV